MWVLWLALPALADEVAYDDALAAGWQSWSWTGTYDFAATDAVHGGSASIRADAGGWGALSLYRASGFGTAGAISFWFRGDGASVNVMLEADGEGHTETIPLENLAESAPDTWTQVVVDLADYGDHAWTRIDLMDATGSGTSFHVDDLWLLDAVPTVDGWVAAEPVGQDRIVLVGTGDPAAVTVFVDGAQIMVKSWSERTGPDRTYLELATTLHAGTLTVNTGDATFTRELAEAAATIDPTPSHTIPDAIYGQAFTDADQIAVQGVSVVRWGGNAVTMYNPFSDVSNAGSDWYFENRDAGSVEEWITSIHDAGAAAFLTVPALDWVAKDNESCAYSVARYGAQQSTDPWRPDCGDGVLTNGTEITWNDPEDHAEAWSPDRLRDWLRTVPDAPDYVAIDNELDITSSTHRDVHPDPLSYDELYTRWMDHAEVVREVMPDVLIAGPSSCCWWYYWNDAAGTKGDHGGEDLLPWWLARVAEHDQAGGVRTLDVLDLHYYPAGSNVFSDEDDPDTQALRLRSTRSLWDPTYTDESWIGTDTWATQTQPNPNVVMLIPRFRTLIDDLYPGTQLGVTEWNFGAEGELSGGLAVADVLGVFGRERLDVGTYWTTPAAGTPAAAAFTLFRRSDAPFGDQSLPVTFDDPDHLGVYAAIDAEGRATLVVVNKDPDRDLLLELDGLPDGTALVRRFGGAVEGEVIDDPELVVGGVLAVPAYSAMFFAIGEETSGGGDDTDTGGGGDGDGDGNADGNGDTEAAGCGCDGGVGGATWLAVGAAAGLARRRRRS